MIRPLWKAAGLIVFPVAVFLGTIAVINTAVQHHCATDALAQAGVGKMGLRLQGYTPSEFRKYWGALANPGLQKCDREPGDSMQPGWAAERRFLLADLGFPLVYGGAILAALLVAWRAAGRPFRRGWVIAPVAALVVADWTENSLLLTLTSRWHRLGEAAVSDGSIRLASATTSAKVALVLLCAGLLLWLVFGRPAPAPAAGLAPALE